MPTKPYFLNGVKLPSVTQILKQSDMSGLISAANHLGLKGRAIYGKEGEWSIAADIGTTAHAMIEAHIQARGVKVEDCPRPIEEGIPAFESFLAWAGGRTFTGECEVSLVSSMGFGGTADYVEGDVLYDWKTSKSLTDWGSRAKFIAQISAYWSMLNETRGYGHEIQRAVIVRFPKEGGAAEELHVDKSMFLDGKKLFLALLEAYVTAEKLNDVPKVPKVRREAVIVPSGLRAQL